VFLEVLQQTAAVMVEALLMAVMVDQVVALVTQLKPAEPQPLDKETTAEAQQAMAVQVVAEPEQPAEAQLLFKAVMVETEPHLLLLDHR
jgi:hypothetical protein